MPRYDGIGVIAEKHAVVLEVGAAFTKVGYAGEASPRAIIRSPNLKELGTEFHDTVVAFVHKLYFEHLLVNPKDRRVVLVEDIIGATRYCRLKFRLNLVNSAKMHMRICIRIGLCF